MNPGPGKQRLRAVRYGDMALAIPFVAAAGYGIGYALDQLAGTTWLRALFLIVSIVGAFTRLVMQVLKDGKSK
jgi:F0F1-type ATP synthase assembly protein I